MCGIAGSVAVKPEDPVVQRERMMRMIGMLRHRGSDEFGEYHDTTAALGSARLSIIDLGGGQQPITNEDRSLWIVFNGEVFNYIELRADLEQRGHRFTTRTDTEVLLYLYEEHGAECLQYLNGQFAVAIWDNRRRRLFLARDRLGIRPLFYTWAKGTFLFASEIKAILANPGIAAEIDPATLEQVFVYWSPLAGRTIFRSILEIPPGHYLTYDDGRVSVTRYWSVQFPPESRTSTEKPNAIENALEEFKDLLVDAALIRLRADVPVGAYLSGGLDSSIISHIISSRSQSALTTFSVTFDDAEFDESEFQLRMARHLGTRHQIAHVTHADIARVFPDVIWHTEVPIMRTAPAPMFLLSRLVHDCGFKVVLTGEGADEFLAGYDIFKEAAVRRFWARRPESQFRPALFRGLYRDIPTFASTSPSFLNAFFAPGLQDVSSPYYSHMIRWRNNARTLRFLSKDVLTGGAPDGLRTRAAPDVPETFRTWGNLQRSQYLESTVFLSQYLLSSQGDRMAMAHSVESRLPFLDYRVVEFCNRLPSSLKLRCLKDKFLLRRFGRECLPSEVWQRPKRPYRAPIHRSFFCAGAPDYVQELLLPQMLRRSGLFDAAAVAQLVKKCLTAPHLGETDAMALSGVLSTQLVYRQFVANMAAPQPLSDRLDKIRSCVGDAAAVA